MDDKVKLISCIWNTHAPQMLYSLLSKKDELNSITLLDGTTKLLDLLLAMNDSDRLSQFLSNLVNVNVTLNLDSPFWPGCSILHLAVLMTEETKLWEEFLKKSDSQQKLDLLLQVHKPTEENKTKYQKRIEICLEKGCSVGTKNADGLTPIHLAFNLHDAEITDLLLKRCTENLDKTNILSFLHIACALGNLEVVKQFINFGADINSQTTNSFKWFIIPSNVYQQTEPCFATVPENSTALHIAVIFQHEDIIKILLDFGADVYVQNKLGLTPIHLSISSTERVHNITKSIAQLLLKRTAALKESLDSCGLSLLHVAAYADKSDAIKKLLKMGSKIDSIFKVSVPELEYLACYANRTPLHVAIYKNSTKAAATLIARGADIFQQTPNKQTPLQAVLHYSTSKPHVLNSIKYRLKCNQRFNEAVDVNGTTLLHVACFMCDFEWVKELLKKGADVNAQIINDFEDEDSSFRHLTPIHMFIKEITEQAALSSEEMINFVKLLTGYKANLLIPYGDGQTLLQLIHYSACTEPWEKIYDISEENGPILLPIADLLLENQHTYEVNPIDYNGFSHFHYACMRNQVEVVKKYLDSGIDINHAANVFLEDGDQDATNFTGLHFAMYYHCKEVAYLLIRRGANLNLVNASGETPLHIAIIRKFIDLQLFESLHSHGAVMNSVTSYGTPPIYYLVESNSEITLEQLKFFMAYGPLIEIEKNYCYGTFGLAMINAKPRCRESIFEEFRDFYAKNAATTNCNPIVDIVNVKQDGKLTLAFYLDAIQRFLDMGYKLDEPTVGGNTALYDASSNYNFEAVEALLLLGANINVFGENNRSPLDIHSYYELDIAVKKILAAHVWKMKFVGLKVHKVNEEKMLAIHQRFPLNEDLKRQCEDELAKLAAECMGQSLFIRSFLREWGAVMDYPTLSVVQRENVEQFFENPKKLRQDFPQFCGLLMIQYRKAKDRLNSHENAMNLLPSVLQIDYLPYLCLENILKYFDNEELDYFIKVQFPYFE